jgi:glutamine---fructose-6-phosphate transaminase (isomerizing)
MFIKLGLETRRSKVGSSINILKYIKNMCGIFGYIGPRESYTTIIKGLKRMEYRGYDSTGIALLDGSIQVYKKAGKVSELEASVYPQPCNIHIGMGHTRWATHGAPNDVNAHICIRQAGNYPQWNH